MATQEPSINFELQPIEGSASSFVGHVGSTQVFVKKNGSPLLPSLSTEGISPKILWIRNTPEGDTLTAQSWIEGHTLRTDEMAEPQVGKILEHLHNSRALRDSLSTFDRSVARPAELLNALLVDGSPVSRNNYLRQIADDMLQTVPALNNLTIVVVHGNVAPESWLKDEKTGRVYLTNWDQVSLGDSFYDTAFLLSHYIARRDWGEWLAQTGYDVKDILVLAKIKWYGRLSFLKQINRYLLEGNTFAANAEILALRKFGELF